MSDWCILRCSGRHTLPLAQSLASGGFDAWTPTAKLKRRLPRTKATIDVFAPIMPQYVFAKECHFDDLLRIEPRHPLFSMYRWQLQDGNWYFPFVSDRSLEALRQEDYRTPKAMQPPKPKYRQYHPGEIVTVPDGAWAGMEGIVERTKGKFVIVAVGQKDITIAAWKLDEHHRQAA